MLFVGIPLPGTGAWTGALIASLLEVDIKNPPLRSCADFYGKCHYVYCFLWNCRKCSALTDRREGMPFDRNRIENKEIPYRICKMICVLCSVFCVLETYQILVRDFFDVLLHIRQMYTKKILT